MNITSKKFNLLDIMKFVMAIVIVSIHCNVVSNITNVYISNLVRSLQQIAVPFFFISSSFLMGIKSDNVVNSIKNYIIRFVKLYFLWSLIYLPLAIYDYIKNGYSFITCIIQYFKDLLLMGQHAYSWHLWYLLATVYGMVFLYLLLKKV